MQSRLKFSRKTLLFFLSSIGLIVIAIGIFILVQARDNNSNVEGSICKTSEYSQIRVGMSKEQVTKLWGKPSSERVKTSSDQNFFYQGSNEANIKEGWIYTNDHPDSAEIYFDTAGLINGKNCGQG